MGHVGHGSQNMTHCQLCSNVEQSATAAAPRWYKHVSESKVAFKMDCQPFRLPNLVRDNYISNLPVKRLMTQSASKGKGLDTCYSATYTSQTRDQQRFTISEVAADSHEPMVSQHIMWPSIARANGLLDPRCS